MTKTEFIDLIAANACIPKTEARVQLDNVMDALFEAITEGNDVPLGEAGKLVVGLKPERNAHNPRTGEKIVVPARYGVKYRPSKHVKEIVGALPV